MKQVITLLIIITATFAAGAQKVSYTLEFPRLDSFFLVEKASQYFTGSPRPQEVVTAIPFRDTSELTAFYKKLEAEHTDVLAEIEKLKYKSDFMAQRLQAINALKKNGVWAYAVVETPQAPPAPAPAPPKKPGKKKRG